MLSILFYGTVYCVHILLSLYNVRNKQITLGVKVIIYNSQEGAW